MSAGEPAPGTAREYRPDPAPGLRFRLADQLANLLDRPLNGRITQHARLPSYAGNDLFMLLATQECDG
jgi:hypothetical protein